MSGKFSIIIPCYNIEDFIGECLDSILSQKYSAWECICIDDGSTDGTGAILDSYAKNDDRFIVVHQANGGVSAARNRGLELCSGEYVCFVDGDDTVKSDWLGNYNIIFEKYNVDLIRIAVSNAKTEQNVNVIKDSAGVLSWGWKHIPMAGFPWLYSVKSDLAKKVRFPLRVEYAEDSLYALCLLRLLHTIAYTNYAGYIYRLRGGSAISKHFSSAERVNYLIAAEKLAVGYKGDLAVREFSQAVSFNINGWLARSSDDRYKIEIRSRLRSMQLEGALSLRDVRWLYRVPLLMFLVTGLVAPSRLWFGAVEILLKLKHAV